MRSIFTVVLIVAILTSAMGLVSALPSPTSKISGNRTCEGKTQQIDVAIVLPTFTLTAYAPNSFYKFYQDYGNLGPKTSLNTQYVTEGLDLITTEIINETDTRYSKLRGTKAVMDWYNARIIAMNFSYPVKTYMLSDEDIHNGNIIDPSQPKYNKCDLVILGHQEYVTTEEYYNLKKFVSNGGRLMIMDGNAFFAEVTWNKSDNTITLKDGHGWYFDGTAATYGPREKFFAENINWVGSVYLCNKCVTSWGNMPFSTYLPDEENYIANHTAVVISDYAASTANGPVVTVATYEKKYGFGKVVVMGLKAYTIVSREDPAFPEFFEKLVMDHALKGKLV